MGAHVGHRGSAAWHHDGVVRRVALAVWLSLVGAIVLSVGSFADGSKPIVLAGGGTFLIGIVLVGVTAAIDARQSERSMAASLWAGTRAAFGWLLQILP